MPPESLFAETGTPDRQPNVVLSEHAVVLRGWALGQAPELMGAIQFVASHSPFRRMVTPGGWEMSVAMTNCGSAGWVTDRSGYRYDGQDPETARPWPAMPDLLSTLATEAASAAGYADFQPDACLINRYAPGARLSLHQDRNEADFAQPIVSISLGLPAIFLWGGQTRADRPVRVPLMHGDVAVWGGPDRLNFHGVHPLAEGSHALTGNVRYNFTFRKAG